MIAKLFIITLLATSAIARSIKPDEKCVVTSELIDSANARLRTLKAFDANVNLKCVDMSVKFIKLENKCIVTCPFVDKGINYNMHGSAGDNLKDFYLDTVNEMKEVCKLEEGEDICAHGSVRNC